VAVPERRDRTNAGTIRLAVAVVRAAGTKPQAPATILLTGGPGEGAVRLLRVFDDFDRYEREGAPATSTELDLASFAEFAGAVKTWRRRLADRALVLLDQRGTGYSRPSLDCVESDLMACRARLLRDGIDLSAYTTVENAADVDSVRQALGYKVVDLNGGSYGTRLAFEVLRRYGTHVRSAVLDGVAPAQLPFETETVRGYERALRVLFDHCASVPSCSAAYPQLDVTFYKTVTTLDRAPVKVAVPTRGTQTIDGQEFRRLVWQGMFGTLPIPWLPMLISDTARGNLGTLAAYIESTSSASADDGIADGMRWSVECSGQVAGETVADVVSAGTGLPAAIREGVVDDFVWPLRLCEQWNVPPADPVTRTPVSSAVPVLMFSGEFDPGTPPAYAKIAAETLSHATLVVLPGLGHTRTAFSICGAQLMTEFLANPQAKLDSSCVAAMPEPSFVTAT